MTIDELGFNADWAKGKTKAQFVEEFVGMDHVYANYTKADKATALESAWKKLRNEPEEIAPAEVSGGTPVSIVTTKEKPAK